VIDLIVENPAILVEIERKIKFLVMLAFQNLHFNIPRTHVFTSRMVLL
jgi:hypothetical protein